MQHKHIESVVRIYFSRDYGNFRFLKGNRDINEAKVKKIIKVINGGLDILKYAPIIVNEEMQIIDGQHRFCVARELKTNVHYVISREIGLDGVPKINSNASNWKTKDYLNSYADMKIPTYLTLIELIKSYPKLNLSTAVKLIHSGHTHSTEAIIDFKDGVLEDTFLPESIKLLDIVKDFEGYIVNPFSSRMISAIKALLERGKYDHELMIAKLKSSNRKIENIGTQKHIIEEMESIINHKSRNRIIIY